MRDCASYKLHIEAMLIREDFQTTVDTLKPAIDAVIRSARGITIVSSKIYRRAKTIF